MVAPFLRGAAARWMLRGFNRPPYAFTLRGSPTALSGSAMWRLPGALPREWPANGSILSLATRNDSSNGKAFKLPGNLYQSGVLRCPA